MNGSLLKKVFRDTLPVLSGYLVLGIGFGIVLNNAGYGLPYALAMSLFIYAGSMQYAAIGLFTGGASLLTVGLTTFFVNCRHLFYGISMVDRYQDTGKKKPYLIFSLTDETYSLVCREKTAGAEYGRYCLLVSLFDQMYWVTGSVLGSVFGRVLPFSTEGVDFALTALFITVMTDQWLNTKNHFPALTGVLATVACRLLFGSGSFLIPAMLVIAAALLAGRPLAKEGSL